MLTLALRFGVLTLGVIFVWLAAASWQAGEPPFWTLIKPSEAARVIDSTVRTERISNGTQRYFPMVTVEWPAGAGQGVALEGLRPAFFGYSRHEAEEIAAAYAPNAEVAVFRHEGRVYAKRLDLFRLLHAAGMTAFAVLFLLVGTALALPLRRR